MPTSKDILDKADKTLKSNQIVPMVYNDAAKQGEQDIAAYGKARAELSTSINSMKGLCEGADSKLKALNAGLSELKKNEAVMKAPADAAKYKKLVADYTAEIKEGMELDKKLTAVYTKATQMFK
jgi:hypothetical protein